MKRERRESMDRAMIVNCERCFYPPKEARSIMCLPHQWAPSFIIHATIARGNWYNNHHARREYKTGKGKIDLSFSSSLPIVKPNQIQKQNHFYLFLWDTIVLQIELKTTIGTRKWVWFGSNKKERENNTESIWSDWVNGDWIDFIVLLYLRTITLTICLTPYHI